jgi:DNA polymerase-1
MHPIKHLVIVDGHHLLYRAYWAIPRTMKTSKGEQVNVAFGLVSMLLQILKTEEPDGILFCFDAGDETFRHQEYGEYKSGRAETPDDFYAQIPRALELIDAFGIRSVSGKKYEADDYACTYAVHAVRQGSRVTIVSGDRDLLQLASDQIRIAIPHKGYQAAEYLGPKEVLAKYGVTPEQIPSYKGLVGDPSDNLPGVKGIGPVAAASLIQQYGSIENIYAHLQDVKSSWRKRLEEGKEQAIFCHRMSELVPDIPLPVPLDALLFQDIPTEPIFELFHELEFTLLVRRFQTMLQAPYGHAHFRPSTGASEFFEDTIARHHSLHVDLPAAEPEQMPLL